MSKKLVFLIVLFLFAAFYWFQWRPAQIKQKCNKYIEDLPGEMRVFLVREEGRNWFEAEYKYCLHKYGL